MKSFEIFSEIASSTTSTGDLDIQLNTILEITGQYTRVSRTYIFLDNEDNSATSNIYEWCNTGIIPQVSDLQDLPYEMIPSWRKILHRDGKVYSENIMELPEDLVAVLQPLGTVSLVVFPIYILNTIRGFVGFDECKNKRKWEESELNLFAAVSGIISNIYDKQYCLHKIDEEKTTFKDFINTINDFIFIADHDKNILYTNDLVVKELGYSTDELRNMKMYDLCPAEKWDEALEVCKASKNRAEYCPIDLTRKDGNIVPVETRIWFGKWNHQDCIFGLSKNLSKEQELLQKFTKLFQNNPALMAVSSLPDRKFIDVNASFITKLGYSYDEIIGKTAEELGLFIHPDKQEEISDKLQKQGKIDNFELEVRCKNNDILYGLFSAEKIESQGKHYFLTVLVDITQQKYIQYLYDIEKTRLQSIIKGSSLGTWEWNVQTGATVFNERWAEIIGYTLSELQPCTIDTWVQHAHPDDLEKSDEMLEKHFNGECEYYDTECRMLHKNGYWVWIHDRGKVIEWDSEGKPLMMYGTHFDITEKKELENKIKELSLRDPLTNVYNRRYIYERLHEDFLKFERSHILFSISILDIDYFKKINDSYGHQAGDFILKEFTSIISANLRETDLLGRFGGEEFILVTYVADKERTAYLINRIMEIIRSHVFNYNNNEIKITFSGGICDVSEDAASGLHIEDIIAIADLRLYLAKAEGRNRIVFKED